MRRAAIIAAFALALALPLSPAAAHRPTRSADAYDYQAAERVTGDGVLCFSPTGWRRLAAASFLGQRADGFLGFWLYSARVIALQSRECRALVHWRSADAYDLSYALFTLGHEQAHGEQHGGLPPFTQADEHAADCTSLRHFQRLRRALGIHRRLAAPLGYCGR